MLIVSRVYRDNMIISITTIYVLCGIVILIIIYLYWTVIFVAMCNNDVSDQDKFMAYLIYVRWIDFDWGILISPCSVRAWLFGPT